MNKSTVVILIYIFGIIFGALAMDIWGAETSFIKTLTFLFKPFIFSTVTFIIFITFW